MTIPSRYSICDSATPAKSIATSSSRLPITRRSSVPNRRAAFSALTSVITSATSVWPGSTPPDFLPSATLRLPHHLWWRPFRPLHSFRTTYLPPNPSTAKDGLIDFQHYYNGHRTHAGLE